MTITEFLLARIAEDEEVAREVMSIPVGVERTASVPQSPTARWQGYNPDGSPMLVHVPSSDAPAAPYDEVGHWGWSGGPVVLDPSSSESKLLGDIFGDVEDRPDEPYTIGDSGLWDESEPSGAVFYRATVPAAAGKATARHIARHNPRRVLAECQAKRAIVDMHKPTTLEDLWGAARPDIAKRLVCEYDSSPDSHLGDTAEWPCTTLRHLAAVYAGHPDYQEEWRPT